MLGVKIYRIICLYADYPWPWKLEMCSEGVVQVIIQAGLKIVLISKLASN